VPSLPITASCRSQSNELSLGLAPHELADAQRRLKPVKRKNPGKPYIAGLVESMVTFWHRETSEFPSRTRKSAKRTKSRRVLFWDFADRALVDLCLQDQPIDSHVRSAIDRMQKGETPPSNS